MKPTTTQIPQLDLGCAVYSIDHLCALLQVRKSAACAVARTPGFPAPIRGARRHRRWSAAAVLAWLDGQAQDPATGDDTVVIRPRTAGRS